jgi:hypothetical protein
MAAMIVGMPFGWTLRYLAAFGADAWASRSVPERFCSSMKTPVLL